MNTNPLKTDEQTTNMLKQTLHPKHRRKRKRLWLVIALVTLASVIGIALNVRVLTGKFLNSDAINMGAGEVHSKEQASLIIAKVVRPKKQSSVSITIDQIATVEPYYRADLRARASGLVTAVYHDIGEKVEEGEVLVVIDVPESDQDVARSRAMILQRQQELKVSEAKLRDTKAAKDVSAATIKQRLADVQAAIATRDLRKRKFERYQKLAAKGSVVGSVVEEEERDFLASEANVTSANANVEKARADYSESESKIEAAAADIDLKLAQIEVAEKDLDRSKAIANYGKITAPFDGVVVKRTVDPGSFVQNATTGTSEALITIAKVDLVTVSAKFPDSVAPSIAIDMPALVTVNDLPGVTISARVTRFAPMVQNADRTMRIEVDLFNGDESEYDRLSQLMQSGSNQFSKGAINAMPMRAFPVGSKDNLRLIPGMTGTIKLTTGSFSDSFVLPSVSVYSRSGVSYILVVQDGITKELPVRVRLNDGKAVLVSVIENQDRIDGVRAEVFSDLIGNEEVVIARQLDIGIGTSVKSAISEW